MFQYELHVKKVLGGSCRHRDFVFLDKGCSMKAVLGPLLKLLTSPGEAIDIASAAKALGMEHSTIKVPTMHESPAGIGILRAAFERLALAAQKPGSEVIELAGAPSMFKGKRARIIAVLEDEAISDTLQVKSEIEETSGVAS